jgi:hypothetical protein
MNALLYLNLQLLKNRIIVFVKTPKHIIPTIILFSIFIFPMIAIHSLDVPTMEPPYTSETVKPIIFSFLTFIIWVNIIQATTKDTLIFSLPEIDFLFPSPLKRKMILLNRILTGYLTSGAQFLGLIGFILFIFSTVFIFSLWRRLFFMWSGIVLALIFTSNLGGIISLISSHLPEMNRSRNRNILIGIVMGFLAIIGGSIIWYMNQGLSVLDAMRTVLNSVVMRALMYPLAIASDISVAWRFTPLLFLKMLLLITLCGVTLGIILSIEAHFYEASEASSRELWQSLEKVKRQEIIVSESFAKRMKTIAPFGRGATTLIWKNLTGLFRDIRNVIPTIILACFFFLMTLIRGFQDDFIFSLIFLFFIALITSNNIRWDLREDLRRIEIIKLIPDSNFRIITSEITTPILFSTFICYIFLVLNYIIYPPSPDKGLLTGFAIGALPLFSLVIVAISNLSVLYYPPQTNTQLIPSLLSILGMIVVITPSAVILLLFYLMDRLFLGLILMLLINVLSAFILLKVLAWKYRTFDLTIS